MGLTKTSFMRGIQCPRMLWLDKHRPEFKTISAEIQKRLDQGNEFGDCAMGLFGPFVEVTTFFPNTTFPDTKSMVEKTRQHISIETPVICEAAFRYNGNYCAVDILRKVVDGYELYEVKDARQVEEQHIKDAAFQAYIVSKSGINLSRICIIYHGEGDNLFACKDVTTNVIDYFRWVEENLEHLNCVATQAEEVKCTMGKHCTQPYDCWYYEYCRSCNI